MRIQFAVVEKVGLRGPLHSQLHVVFDRCLRVPGVAHHEFQLVNVAQRPLASGLFQRLVLGLWDSDRGCSPLLSSDPSFHFSSTEREERCTVWSSKTVRPRIEHSGLSRCKGFLTPAVADTPRLLLAHRQNQISLISQLHALIDYYSSS